MENNLLFQNYIKNIFISKEVINYFFLNESKSFFGNATTAHLQEIEDQIRNSNVAQYSKICSWTLLGDLYLVRFSNSIAFTGSVDGGGDLDDIKWPNTRAFNFNSNISH